MKSGYSAVRFVSLEARGSLCRGGSILCPCRVGFLQIPDGFGLSGPKARFLDHRQRHMAERKGLPLLHLIALLQ